MEEQTNLLLCRHKKGVASLHTGGKYKKWVLALFCFAITALGFFYSMNRFTVPPYWQNTDWLALGGALLLCGVVFVTVSRWGKAKETLSQPGMHAFALYRPSQPGTAQPGAALYHIYLKEEDVNHKATAAGFLGNISSFRGTLNSGQLIECAGKLLHSKAFPSCLVALLEENQPLPLPFRMDKMEFASYSPYGHGTAQNGTYFITYLEKTTNSREKAILTEDFCHWEEILRFLREKNQ